MQNKERTLHLDICDYNKRRLCPLYDNNANVSGQATDIFVTTERNGWKELSFTLPSVCNTEYGIEPNYRLSFLKADFLIRLVDDQETDWFIISEPKITHNAYAKTFHVTAGHVSQLLKHKNLGLEFSDSEGNNVGTAEELAKTILDGTGWSVGYVYPFAEKDGTTKYRSLKASAKTGAFKLITTMCELFDAKPIYHGDARTVDIVPINPFSEPAPGMPPEIPENSEVVELHYGKNVSNVTRTLNTENMVTKLYAYGAYGDKTSGYCGIDECKHIEYVYVLTQDCPENQAYYFTFDDAAGVSLTYHFTPKTPIKSGSKLIYSLLDPCSQMYIWDDSNQNAYPVTKGTKGTQLPASSSKEEVQNWFQFVMNFDYYREVGLLTDDMLQIVADYQRKAPALYQKISDASLQMSNSQTTLSETIGYIDFCKLAVLNEDTLSGNGYVTLELDKNKYKDGVIYRTDYAQNKDNYFKWRVTDSLNADGDPINSAAGVIYIIHDTNPVTWDKAYLKKLDDEDNPTYLTLWAETGSIDVNPNTDQFFLFSYNGINGRLGTLESNDESAVMSIEEAVRVVTVDHPVIFTEEDPALMDVGNVNGYGWLWRYYATSATFRVYKSEMYFAYTDEGDTHWNKVYFVDSDPGGAEENAYWFDWRNSVLYRRKMSTWTALTTSAEQKVAALFATVYMFGKARDRYYQGLYENYTYAVPSGSSLAPGNYFIENEYNSYWTFTTTETLNAGDTLTYNYDDTWITQTKGGIESTLKPKGYRFDNVGYHPSNILNGKEIEDGSLDASSGDITDSSTSCRSQSYISVVPLTEYSIAGTSRTFNVCFYDDNKRMLSSGSGLSFTTPANCAYIRFAVDISAASFTEYDSVSISATNASSVIVIEDLNYGKLSPTPGIGEIIGLVQCIDKFEEYADLTYDTHYKALKAAQDELAAKEKAMTASIGDLYREGWWNDASYVDGDEDKLYSDTLDNLKEISKPDASYNITYLDLYESNRDNADFGAAEETISVQWPDLSMMSAAHLVDPEILVNTWAFMDKIQKCYDKPWQTKIVINTNLSTIAQHSFADVMTNIANVASEMKGKTSYYDKTLNTVVSSEDIAGINAELSKAERELLSVHTRTDQLDGAIVKHSSSFKKTADQISAEVSATTNKANTAIQQSSLAIQTANGFKTTVEQYTQEVGEYKSQVATYTQTVNGFNSTVSNVSGRVEKIENNTIITQTADYIRGVVSGNSEYSGDVSKNSFKTSSVDISVNGIAMSTSGKFSVSAGTGDDTSVVTIDKNGVAVGTSGTFTVDSDNFKVNADGKLYASGVVISGQLYNDGHSVLTKDYDVYIGTENPPSSMEHIGALWIKPGVESSGGGSSTPSVPSNQTVTFTQPSAFSKEYIFTSSGSSSDGPQTTTLLSSGISTASSGSYNYTATLPLVIQGRSDGAKTGGNIKLSLNGGAVVFEWDELEYSASTTDRAITLTQTVNSSTWLGSSTSITATLSVKQHDSAYKTGAWSTSTTNTIQVVCSSN